MTETLIDYAQPMLRIERQMREAAYSISCIATVMHETPVEQRVAETLAKFAQ